MSVYIYVCPCASILVLRGLVPNGNPGCVGLRYNLLYFFNLKFSSDDIEFRKKQIIELSKDYDILPETINEAFDDINEFINFLIDIQKTK